MLPFRIEDKHTGAGKQVRCTFSEAIKEAMQRCIGRTDRCKVYALPANHLVAEVSENGIEWFDRQLTANLT
jgi:hypothetical protein